MFFIIIENIMGGFRVYGIMFNNNKNPVHFATVVFLSRVLEFTFLSDNMTKV